MNALDVLDLLEKTPGKNDKIKILKEHKSSELSELIHAALDFKRKYHIKKFTTTPLNDSLHDDPHTKFMKMLDILQRRVLTGNDAVNEVEIFMGMCNEQQAKWYTRILKKNLQCGFSESSANKAGYKVPKFEVMLAKDGKKNKNIKKLVEDGGFVSKKFDGYRCLADSEDEVVLCSRNGTVFENFPEIEESLILLSGNSEGFEILDGEIMSDNFNSMQQSAFASKRGTTVGDMVYHVFDIIPLEEWRTQKFTTTTTQRMVKKEELRKTLKELGIKNIVVVDHEFTASLERCLILEKEFLAQGYEGAMFLPAKLPYYLGKKSNKLTKFKTFESQDCEVLEVYEGEAGKKYEGTMGGITLRQENGKLCNCGSGFSDEERDLYWNDPSLIVGRVIEASYQELTDDDIMRFPIFKRFRPDKE